MPSDDDRTVLRRELDQLARLLDGVDPDRLDGSTPCTEWTLGDLVDHVVAAPERAARMVRGESIDWAAPTPSAGDDPAATFRARADDLLAAVDGAGDAAGNGALDMQFAELAVHTWDLATALGRPTGDLDPVPAERGLAFMQGGLTDDRRAPAFGPERPAPDDADAYGRIAAFAGRSV